MGKIMREELATIMDMNSENSSQYLIAKEILLRLNFNKQLTIPEIAKNTFSSKPTITRFAQSLGFRGFKDFLKELRRQDQIYYSKGTEKSYHEAFQDFDFELKNLVNGFAKFQPLLKEIANLIITKKRVLVFSSPENILLGNGFADQLCFLGIKVINAIVVDKQLFLLNQAKKNDLAIFIGTGPDIGSLVDVYHTIKDSVITFGILSPSKRTKFDELDHEIILDLPSNALRVIYKQDAIRYLLSQIFNLVVYHEEQYLNKINNLKPETN